MAVNLREVKFAYNTPKKKQAFKFTLEDINLHIDSKDEFITIVGESGSGKSTLVQLLNGLLIATFGDVVVFDKKLSGKKLKLKDTRKKVGLVFQFPEHQLFDDTVLKDVCFGPKNFGMKNYLDLAKDALSVVGIDESLGNYPMIRKIKTEYWKFVSYYLGGCRKKENHRPNYEDILELKDKTDKYLKRVNNIRQRNWFWKKPILLK
jgi:ABC-type oligopeptide transport system ATPase subunit